MLLLLLLCCVIAVVVEVGVGKGVAVDFVNFAVVLKLMPKLLLKLLLLTLLHNKCHIGISDKKMVI